jgi:beta-lactamase superfamily II metal-dependent hydrolase
MRTTIFALMAIALASAPALAGQKDKRLDVYWVDVEGGGGTLIVTPAGESVLIDTGNPGGRDPGRIHDVATKAAGLTKIDHVIITHLHGDHYGGLAELAEKIPIGTLWENGIDSAPEGERNDAKVAAFAAAKVGKRVVVKPGDHVPLTRAPGSPPISLTFLVARKEVVAAKSARANKAVCTSAKQKDPDPSDNANSVVSLLEFGAFRFFDGGDLTWNVEEKLACPKAVVPPVDVFQVNHHGLDVSNNPVLVHTLQPTVAVFNNGARKGCMPEPFATLKGTPTVKAIYQMHRNLVSAESNTAPDLIANKDATCAGDYVTMSVDPRAASYTFRVPSTKHEQTFQTRRK